MLAGCTSGNNKSGNGGQNKNGGKSGGSSKKKIRLGLGHINSSEQKLVKSLKKLVNKKLPSDIEFDVYQIQGQTDQMTQKLKTILSANKSDPDLFNLDTIYVQQFAAAGWLVPFEDHVDKSTLDRYADSVVHAGQWQGKLYAAPQFMDAGGLYYNKKYLKQAGFDKPPTTAEELVTMSQKAVKASNVKYGFVWQGKQYEGLVCDWLEWVHGQGGWLYGGKDKLHKKPGDRPVTIDSKNVVKATQLMRDFIYKDNISPKSVVTMVEDSSLKVFQEGNAVFHRNWYYLPPVLQNSKKSKIVDDWGYTKMIGGHGTLGPEFYGINKNTAHPKAAAKVAKILSTDKDVNLLKFKNGRPPSIKDYWTDSDFTSQGAMGKYLPQAGKVFASAIERPATPLYESESQKVFQKYVSGVLNKNYSAQKGMQKAKKALTKIENDYSQ